MPVYNFFEEVYICYLYETSTVSSTGSGSMFIVTLEAGLELRSVSCRVQPLRGKSSHSGSMLETNNKILIKSL